MFFEMPSLRAASAPLIPRWARQAMKSSAVMGLSFLWLVVALKDAMDARVVIVSALRRSYDKQVGSGRALTKDYPGASRRPGDSHQAARAAFALSMISICSAFPPWTLRKRWLSVIASCWRNAASSRRLSGLA